MKYKNIPSALHNFAHSFVSLVNYVDGVYIRDVLTDELHKVPNHELLIYFPEGRIEPSVELPQSLKKSVQHFSNHYADHLSSQNVEPGSIQECRVLIYGDRLGMHCTILANDDRGKIYDIPVRID
ncbi:MAG: hypothetical protein HC801_07440 [Nitrospira sp.]|nr:hypothetical protein [Nitrospira sp.]